ncbi:hypothetical protein [Corallococcus sicarius]|uniref:Lipoprotein n=1 Tax=Corallococcus sicarius TaxID=2316726 RepID=A0A3A8MIN5_9BACT|nr:hypothetical protein [Corallococcus sicarius]RKH31039.1 hypothetical protein D7X12_38755 [Corallococcus sicarius]
MKKIMIGLAALASLTLTACGGSVCDDLEDSANTLSDKAEKCGFEQPDNDEVTDADREACEESVKSCTDDDKTKIDSFVDCVNDIKECSDKTTAEQNSFSASTLACYLKLQGLSASCAAAAAE